MRVAEHNKPDGAPFARAGNHVMVYGAYMSAAARTAEPRQIRRRRAAPSSTAAQTNSSATDPITRSGDPVRRVPSQANTGPFLPEVWAQVDKINLVEKFKQRVETFVAMPQVIRGDYIRAQDVALNHLFTHNYFVF